MSDEDVIHMVTFVSIVFLQVLPSSQAAVARVMKPSASSLCEFEHEWCDLI